MLGKILINGLLLLGLLLTPAWAEDPLPKEVKNTVREDFGIVALAGDYGLANATPVEIVGQGERQEVRVFRSPQLRLYKHRAKMQVLLGNLKGVYVWVETPPVQGHWHLTIDLLYLDGTRNTILSNDLKPGVRQYVMVEPHTRVDCQIYSKNISVKSVGKFLLTVSPVQWWATWPENLPIPFIPMFHGYY